MKSLHKIFDVLEYVVLRNGANVTPSEVANALSLNLATATRIMTELVKRGYLDHVSRKDGYIAGPMVISLGTRRNPYERIAAAAREPVAELAAEFRRQVNLAVLNLERRVMLCYALSDSEMQPWDHFFFSDQWATATGRLLLSALDDRAALKLVPQEMRPAVKAELPAVRKQDHVIFEIAGETVIGCRVRVPGYPAAAFGFGVAPERAGEALEAATAAARQIEETLRKPLRAY